MGAEWQGKPGFGTGWFGLVGVEKSTPFLLGEMIDLLFVSHNRLRFTQASVECLLQNTQWDKVRLIRIHDDSSSDGTAEFLSSVEWPVPREFRWRPIGGPVAAMNKFIRESQDEGSPILAKIDNDVLLPKGWLGDCYRVMNQQPEVDLLGIECTNDFPEPAPFFRQYQRASHIGGIGLFRRRVFEKFGLPVAEGRQGFTQFQTRHEQIVSGWLSPSLPVALLDHLPMEPWRSLSEEYIAKGWQRRGWGEGDVQYYSQKSVALWEWWSGAKAEQAA